jgi:hypothetical protein
MSICHAYSVTLDRCDMPAGHPGDHSITRTWTDDECFVPGAPVTLKEHGAPIPYTLPEPGPSRCVLCEHKFHNGKCPAMDGEFSCDCSEGVA